MTPAPRQRLSLAQKQLLKLSPAQVRYYRLLEMGRQAIEEEIERELDANPALELREEATALPQAQPSGEDTSIPREELPARFRSARDPVAPPPLENMAGDDTESLQAALSRQIDLLELDPVMRTAALFIAGSLDSNGYLRHTLDELSQAMWQATGLRLPDQRLREALKVVRGLEPAGTGAVDLRDCLLLQLPKECDKNSPERLAREIVTHYFDLLGLKHYDKLCRLAGISREQLTGALETIRSLNPKPGATYASEGTYAPPGGAIIPDFVVGLDEQTGRLTLTMPDSEPDLQIEASFADGDGGNDQVPALPSGVPPKSGQAEALRFIRMRRDDARSFIGLLKLRRDTLFRIMSAIVTLQTPFFLSGDERELRPMVLKDVAAVTGDDPSSISRATAGKYVSTPWRTYPLRHFFSERAGVATDASQHAVAQAISQLVDDEDKNAPLSDEALREALRAQGLDVARRTVAKHREQLGIPVARLRRKP